MSTSTAQPTAQRPPYMLRTALEAVKARVRVEEFAATLTQLDPKGRGRCPVHKGDNPQSFAVYPDEGRWWCYRCDRGGDVIDLAQAVEGGDVLEAMVRLAQQFGVELPTRPDRWHEWQDEKARIRNNLRRALAKRYRRRMFRMFAQEFDGEEEAQEFWDDLWPTAWAWAGLRVAS
jgi:DNA primase